jgi:hypothetical protein
MDHILDHFLKNGALGLARPLSQNKNTLAYIGDVVGLLVSSIGRTSLKGQTLWIPPSASLESWRQAFCDCFLSDESKVWKRVMSQWPTQLPFKKFTQSLTQPSSPPEHAVSFETFLPAPLSPAIRSLQSARDLWQRNPDQRLIFPPPRAL